MSIYESIQQKQKALRSLQLRARNPHTDPRCAHEDEAEAKRTEVEIGGLVNAAEEGETATREILRLVQRLAGSRHKSRERSAAITKLEEAEMWLRRELGAKAI